MGSHARNILTFGDGAEPGNVLPREAWVDKRADSTSDTLIFCDLVALLDFSVRSFVDLLHAHVLLTTAELRSIDGDEETLNAAGLGVLYVLPSDLTVAVDVELDEEGLVVCRGVDDFVERAGGEGGNHLDDIVVGTGTSDGQFTLWVAKLAKSSSRLEERL